jgi:hypothetical protein
MKLALGINQGCLDEKKEKCKFIFLFRTDCIVAKAR